MAHSEIDAIRTLLGSKPRPVGWSERRERLDEVGSTWPVAPDVQCEAVDCDGVAGEWSIAPGSEPSCALLYFHGGGYCSGSIASHRRLVTEAGRAARSRTLATKDAIDPLIHKAYLEELADAYAPPSIDRRDPLISPLLADLAGFPPVLIQVGSAETLLADATRLAEAAGAADVDVTLQIWPHMIHAWPVWNASLQDGRRALVYAGQFIRAHIR